MDIQEKKNIAWALIISIVCFIYIVIANSLYPEASDQWRFCLGKSATTAWLIFIFCWASIFLSRIVPGLLKVENEYAKVGLLVGVFWCLSNAWIYG